MKMNPRAWFNRSRIPMNAAENVTFSANDPAGESSPRSELFSTVQMERYGQKLARTHKVSPDKHPYYLLKRLGDNEAVITQNCYELNAGKKTSIMPAGEWLLDNYYLIEEQIRTVRQHLPKSFGKGLPSLVSPLNCPRIYHIASEAIAHGDGRWDAASLTSYLTAYQQVTPLTLGEIWALPGMLRLALIENLRRISMEVIKAQQDRNLADTWITRIVECAESAPGDLIMVVADMARSRPPLTSAFVAELVRRLQGHGNALSLPLTWVDQCLREQGITTDVLIHSFNQQLAASQLSVSNSIAGLRLLSETDWADFAETISVVEQVLRNDPAGIYPRMHFNTRDHYRHVVEVLARDSGLSEPEVAEKVLAFSEEKASETPEHHVGYYLAGEGRQALDIHLLADASGLIRLRHSFNRITLLSWLGSLALLTTAATAAILRATAMQGADWLLIAVILPLIIALTQLMSDLLSDTATRFRVPRPLPGMDFSAGIPADSATMLVIPCMLTSHESFSQLLTSLEVCWLGNENENLRFALLTDFADSENEPSPESHTLLRQAIADTQALNRRYPSGRPRFYLLHRQPEWNPSEGAWMGYERKRGKLALLNSWLRHPGTQFVSVAEMPAHLLPGHIKYVITLDSDTVLPRDTAHKLVATMAHPLNTPEYDPVRQRVVKGFGILQPGLAEEIPRNGQGRYTSGQDEEVLFTDAGAEFRRSLGGLSVKTQVVISPEDDVELRRLTLIHRGRKPRSLELTTYAEVVLAPDASDLAHPAFSNLFIQTELAPERDAILCHRRPRSPDEPGSCLFHMMVVHGDNRHNVSFETDRARFIGRGRNPANAQAIETGGMLGNTSGSVLDPILAIRNAIILQPGQPVTIDIIYGISETRQQSLALLEKYRDYPIADRVFELAWSHSLVVLRQMNASEDDATLFNSLASAVLYPVQELRAEGQAIGRNRRGQSGLWGWAISGDLPIVLLSITSEESITSVTTLIQAHRYWRQKGLDVDLVILNNSPGGYQQGLQNQIMELIYAGSEASLLDKKGGLFVRNGEHLSAEDKLLLMSVACLYLDDRAGGINEQLNQRIHTLKSPARAFIPRAVRERNQHTDWSPDTSQLCHFNGYGGFSQDGREYQIVLRENAITPAPWSNILANSRFGCVISEAGQAYTWYENAHEYRLTPWENDPVSDRSGEAFYLRDEESGECWSPTALPVRGHGDYLTRHGFGYSVFAHRESGIDSELTVLVAEEDPVKLVLLTLSNSSGRTRQLSVTGYVEWTLGETRTRSAPHIVTHVARTPGGCGVLANNFYGDNGGGRTAFFAVSGNDCSLTGDRREFIGRNGSLHAPSAMKLQKLSGKTGAGLDPCGAVQSAVTLIDGDQRTFIFILGAEENDVCAQEMLARYMNEDTVRQELNRIHNHWHNVLDKIVVNTPDTSVNLLVNGWLLYQTVACRLMARSGYYQSGGAFGFRDQLQDTLALSHAAPDRMREQIILCASRQFIEGDVQHWWHPPHGNGVRTRCSDDYLWLPLAVCHYVETTGDMDALEIRIPYLEGRSLQPGEESVYDTPVISGTEETLWLHCVKAIHYGLRFGEHGLPLMGAGDWNDGMNRVGIEGKGESVWLGFFLYDILQRFAALAERRLDESVAAMCRSQALRLQSNLEAHAWDGEWYRRGYFDDGTPLGSKTSQDCRIDAIAQSWSVLSGAASPGRCAKAMQALDKHLVDNEGGLIKLLTPPFDGHGPNPGYIQGYLPGVRENGGQYTHGAIWAVMAFARMGNAGRAWQLWSMLNPINHTLNADSVGIYKAEPYVMSADVYSVAPHTGRAGWSWYTGSAGWAWRLLTEELLGIKRSGTEFSVHARLPDEWSSFSMAYQYGESHYQISVSRGDAEYCVTLDGVLLPDDRIPLKDDGQNHTVEIIQN